MLTEMSDCRVRIEGGTLEVLNELVYLGVAIDKGGGCRKEVENDV